MISEKEINNIKCPFVVGSDYRIGKKKGTQKKTNHAEVVGFSKNDPLGVGGGIMPNMATAYFKGGGWLLIGDLMRNYSIIKQDKDQ